MLLEMIWWLVVQRRLVTVDVVMVQLLGWRQILTTAAGCGGRLGSQVRCRSIGGGMARFWLFTWNQRETNVTDLQLLALQAKMVQRFIRTARGPALSVYEKRMLDRCFDVDPGSVVVVAERDDHIVVTRRNLDGRRFR